MKRKFYAYEVVKASGQDMSDKFAVKKLAEEYMSEYLMDDEIEDFEKNHSDYQETYILPQWVEDIITDILNNDGCYHYNDEYYYDDDEYYYDDDEYYYDDEEYYDDYE